MLFISQQFSDEFVHQHSMNCNLSTISYLCLKKSFAFCCELKTFQIDYICYNALVVLCNHSVFSSMVQEEIRFMINPELIVGMLFMASMEDNEAIEIFGAQRFSQYMGLVKTLSTFCLI